MSILIVEKDPTTSDLIRQLLEQGGYTGILTRATAQEVASCLGLDDSLQPSVAVDLVILDVVLPDASGLDLCARIREKERWSDLPVIAVTSRATSEDLHLAFAAGINDYLIKPINEAELLARVRAALRLKYETDRRKARERELAEGNKQLLEANRILQRRSAIDGLTGITNRRHFEELYDLEWRRAVRYQSPLGLIMIDIDFFKAYNDTNGHRQGDDCLIQVAGALQGVIHRPGDLLARYGGEEFVAVLPATPLDGGRHVAEAMLESVQARAIPHPGSTAGPVVTVSLGVAAVTPSRLHQPSILVSAADRALYRAKQAGRNRVMVSDELGPA
ncbi:MAG: diguanylate cyclase [Thermodesulfobacteriota bacterium]